MTKVNQTKEKAGNSEDAEVEFTFDNDNFISMFSTQSFAVLKKVAEEFEDKLGFELQEVILTAAKGDFQRLLLNIRKFYRENFIIIHLVISCFTISTFFCFSSSLCTK